ncbi:MAG TPA: hypothetical protein VJ302_19825 [Blastocatellia bacterium]|nr:hypothetical protein [Blastocatellia bacterium]
MNPVIRDGQLRQALQALGNEHAAIRCRGKTVFFDSPIYQRDSVPEDRESRKTPIWGLSWANTQIVVCIAPHFGVNQSEKAQPRAIMTKNSLIY